MIKLSSPAKLNLTFRIVKKRDDGFHEIESLFQAISLCDQLSINLAEKESLSCENSKIPCDETNLIIRAAQLFRQKTGVSQKFQFHLIKKIPIEAGLGGGSSNAATTLWGLNKLLKLNIDDETLAKWGSELGSDISFFFSQGRALCQGRGEKINPETQTCSQTLWIAKPNFGLSSARVYAHVQIEKLENLKEDEFYNDLESFAFELEPQLVDIKQSLLELGFKHVTMTGSGTSFFCIGEVKEPKLSNISFIPAKFLTRTKSCWY